VADAEGSESPGIETTTILNDIKSCETNSPEIDKA
jgi:hypothetical protein